MFKPFYVHRFHQPGHLNSRHPRGFTALIQPNTDDATARTIKMQVTWCSPKDQFSKKEGRSYVAKAQLQVVNKRELPKLLAGCEYICNLVPMFDSTPWNYIYKYVI